MQEIDLTNVQESGDYKKPRAGAYPCVITKVEDVPLNQDTGKGNYLRIHYDIADGEFKGYYAGLRKRYPDSNTIGSYIRSYKQSALGMFKRMCSAVSHSNGNFVFDAKTNKDEQTLVGKKIGLIFGEEEYYSNAGELKTRTYVYSECPIDKIASGDFRVPELKKIKEEQNVNDFVNVAPGTEGEVPF